MPGPAKKPSGLPFVALLLPIACCGLPLLIVAGGTVGAALATPAGIAGTALLVGAPVGYLAIRLARRRRQASCCAPRAPVHDEEFVAADSGGYGSNGRLTETGRTRTPTGA